MTKRNPEQWQELVQRIAKDQDSEELKKLSDQIAAVLRENGELQETSTSDTRKEFQ